MAFFRNNHKRKRTKGERREGEGGHTKGKKWGQEKVCGKRKGEGAGAFRR